MMRNDDDWAGGYVIHSIWCPGALIGWETAMTVFTARLCDWVRDVHQRRRWSLRSSEMEKMEIWNPLLSITWFNAHFELQYKPVSRFICSPVLNDHHQQPQEEEDGWRSLFFLGSDKNDYPVNSTSIGGEAAEGEWILFIICIE